MKLYLGFQRLSATQVTLGVLAKRRIVHAKAAALCKVLLQQMMLIKSFGF